MGCATIIMTHALPSVPVVQCMFFRSSDIDEHEDHVPKIVLVTGGTSVTILPNSLNHNKT